MSPRAKRIIQEARQSVAQSWTNTIMPLLLSLSTIMGGFALRQSGQAKEANETTSDAVGVLVQDNARQVKHHQADDRRIARLEAQVAFLTARLGRQEQRRRKDTIGVDVSGDVGVSAAKPVTIGSIITAPAKWIAGFFHGG